ncbi:MAG: DUF4129 domain-containing protein [bacterium]|nr:DUF4129 domain-containing protein [bacterium]
MIRKKNAPACDFHPDTEARYQCGECLKQLCPQCADQQAHLFFCSHCGKQARLIPQKVEAPLMDDNLTYKGLKELASVLTNHVLMPIAILVMVSAFLFFLLDIRSVFLGDSASLKRVGFFFAAATVLIVRYRRVHGIRGRQMLYTFILGIATIRAMMIYSAGGMHVLVDMLVILVIWRFATSLTSRINLPYGEPEKEEHRLYGLERIHHEEVERKHNLTPGGITGKEKAKKNRKRPSKKSADAHGNPAGSVSRLVMLALVSFAVGEPFLLSAAPEIGERALVSVMVFILSSAVVLAGSSVVGTYKYTLRQGGKASSGMLPIRIAIAFLVALIVASAALTLPGIKFRGSGIKKETAHKAKGNIKGDEDNKSDMEKEGVKGKKAKSDSQKEPGEDGSAPKSFLGMLSRLGKFLLIPFLVLAAFVFLYFLVKLRPNLKLKAGLGERLQRLLDRLKSLFRFKGRGGKSRLKKVDPVKMMAGLEQMGSRDAVLRAYACFLAFLEQAGYKRLERLTPHEFLSSLPMRFHYLAGPAGEITELYIDAAFRPDEPGNENGEKAVAALGKLRQLIEENKAPQ